MKIFNFQLPIYNKFSMMQFLKGLEEVLIGLSVDFRFEN